MLSLERGLAVIKSFGERHQSRTLSEVAVACGLTRAAARRFLLTLQSLGYVALEDRRFSLTPRTLDLGYAYLASLPWWRPAQRVAEKIGGETRQACAVGVLDGDTVVYVAYAPASYHASLMRSTGTRLPAHATATGRVLLGALADEQLRPLIKSMKLQRFTPLTATSRRTIAGLVRQARADGFAIVNQELEEGLRGIGVPIRDRGGRIVAAMSLSIRDSYMPLADFRKRFLKPLQSASEQISRDLPA